jgi:DNA polymerase
VTNSDDIHAVDYEVYYDREYSLSKMALRQFVEDPRFDPFLVSIHGANASFSNSPASAPWERIAGKPWLAHHSGFDQAAHEQAIMLGIVPEWARPSRWICSANLSVYRQAPRNLEGAAREILGKQLDKDIRSGMKGRRFADLSDEEAEAWRRYALEDAVAAFGIWEAESGDWPEHERRLSDQTYRIGRRGVAVDVEKVEEGIRTLRESLWLAEKEIPWADSEAKTLSPKALAEACRAAGIPVPPSTAEDDPRCEEWENEYGSLYPWVAAMRTFRKANKALRTLETIRERTDADGIMQFALKYCGAAATARWAGDSGLNMQNLRREESFGVNIRESFIARPGKRFVIADLRQIEPIVLAWLIGDEEFLAHVRAGRDTYEAHARASMGYNDSRPLKEVDKSLRALAKARVLGLSYGASHEPFVRIAKQMAGLDLDSTEARRVVQEFRRSNPLITGLWHQLDLGFKMSKGDTYTVELPSGREIRYFDVSPRGWNARVTRGDAPRRFWGSKLVENLIQGTARDVFAECLLRLEDAGFDIIWHVHDEAIVEVDENDTDAADEVVRLMSVTPEWAHGLPVSAEAVVSRHYLK